VSIGTPASRIWKRLASQWYIRSESFTIRSSWIENQMSAVFIERSAVTAAANLLRSMGATQVFIFGSAAKGDLRPDSDVDMAVTGLPSQKYFSAVSRVSDLIGRPVDLVDLDDSTPLVRYLLASGELVRVE
jgi:predicted nucleotidyltransferase